MVEAEVIRKPGLPRRLIVMTGGLLLLAYGLFFVNPAGFGIAESSRFSWERFEQVKAGQPIADVIASLGPPIREPEPLQILNPPATGTDPCYPAACRTYRFLGRDRGTSWPVLGYREAIVVVGPDGRVISTIAREE